MLKKRKKNNRIEKTIFKSQYSSILGWRSIAIFYFKTFSRSLVVILKKIQQLKVRTFSHAF